jgi:hypothetical protein
MRGLAAAAAALALAGSAAAALPRDGAFVPGHSLGGIRLGETAAAVRAKLGRSFGVCDGCATTTWYFTYHRFDQRGLGVELTDGKVSAVYTLWMPGGWHAPQQLELGSPEGELTTATGALISIACAGYDARVADGRSARSVYYVAEGKLWGFGLVRAHADPCR